MNKDCNQVCTCLGGPSPSCSLAACAPGKTCTTANFTQGCYRGESASLCAAVEGSRSRGGVGDTGRQGPPL